MIQKGTRMFGYLQVKKSELRVREWEAYKSVYCGLCRQLGKDYSVFTRLTLSYDVTFYTMLLMSLNRSCKGFDKGRCRFNPLKKCRFARCEGDAYRKAAAFSVISSYYKLQDDLTDSGFFKHCAVRLVRPFFRHWKNKAVRQYPELEPPVAQMMERQAKTEADAAAGLDAAAHPTALMLAEVLCTEAKDAAQRRIFYEFGYQLGRWIYLIDAADDLEKDIKHDNYNPFKCVPADELQQCESAVLSQSLARAYDAYQLMQLTDFKGIFDNMLLYGFPSKQNTVIYRLQEETNDQSV